MRKIPKRTPEYDQEVSQMLKDYKNSDYKEQLFYAIETETHFEIVTPLLSK